MHEFLILLVCFGSFTENKRKNNLFSQVWQHQLMFDSKEIDNVINCLSSYVKGFEKQKRSMFGNRSA